MLTEQLLSSSQLDTQDIQEIRRPVLTLRRWLRAHQCHKS